ncbi:CvpA family protein [Acuticoccus sp. I52.16.1]|uniref:CvpA family protein n=1 Tax=Acuticoccus sp. I52.16.1 TaxID=2928472 RepID=UPI001FD3E930|nr:CvpA family protein [Acuticoccus sp. I52.16.1]UOM33869.1 CvpA family protein [Acuticoccus sp. I52.16.1]
MNIAILDGVVIAVVFISAVLAMFRGFVREVLSIAAWVAAAVLAYMFYEQALPYVSQYVDNQTIAIGLSAAGIFLVSLIVVSLITMKISDFVMDSPVGAVDRLVGFVFGAARGLLLVVVAVIFFNWLVAAPDRPAWVTTAASYPKLSELGERLLAAIPDDPEQAIRGAFEDGGDSTPAPTTPGSSTDAAAPSYQPNQQQELDQTIDAASDPATGSDDNTVIQPQPLGGDTPSSN